MTKNPARQVPCDNCGTVVYAYDTFGTDLCDSCRPVELGLEDFVKHPHGLAFVKSVLKASEQGETT